MRFERQRAWIASTSVEGTRRAGRFDLFVLRMAERAVSGALKWRRRHSRPCSRGERVSMQRAVLGARTDERVVDATNGMRLVAYRPGFWLSQRSR